MGREETGWGMEGGGGWVMGGGRWRGWWGVAGARQTSLKGRERAVTVQKTTGAVFKEDVGQTSERWGGAHMGFFRAHK